MILFFHICRAICLGGAKKMLLMNVAAMVSGIVCLLVFANSVRVALQLRHIDEACRYRAWNGFVVCYNGSVRPATRLLFEFHLARWLTLAALLPLIAGYVLSPAALDGAFKSVFDYGIYQAVYPTQINNLLSVGTIIGWICSISTLRYFPLVDKKLIKRR